MVTLAGCLSYVDTKVGKGALVKYGDTLTATYIGWLADGFEFDSTAIQGGTPFHFVVGGGDVVPGWDLGVVGMRVGGQRRLIIPPAYAYGSASNGPIPPHATLIFDITAVSIG
jgi:peptidylprolyl isomerase